MLTGELTPKFDWDDPTSDWLDRVPWASVDPRMRIEIEVTARIGSGTKNRTAPYSGIVRDVVLMKSPR